MKLGNHQYGKGRVRVARVRRDGKWHTVHEVDVQVTLRGEFAASFTAADNSLVIPTDTMKNTVNVLAQSELADEIERFGLALGEHFLRMYPQISEGEFTLTENAWQRIDGHPHTFTGNDSSHRWAQVTTSRSGSEVCAGVRNFLVLKSTGSGFSGYPKCGFTTLPETDDRILSTLISATWQYAATPASYAEARRSAMHAMLRVFAENYSPSVQVTLYEMGRAALEAVPEASRIHLALSNKHYLPVNFVPFGRINSNEVFTPTDEPHGQIEATVER